MAPQRGDYGVVDSRPRGMSRLISASIRLLTRSPWSHAFIVIDDGLVIEASSKGARIAALSEYDPADCAFDDLEPKTAAERAAIVAQAHVLLGTPYNFLDIFALALIGLGLRWSWPCNRAGRTDRMICSQLVASCYAHAGLSVSVKPVQLVTPGDLGRRLDQRPWELATK